MTTPGQLATFLSHSCAQDIRKRHFQAESFKEPMHCNFMQLYQNQSTCPAQVLHSGQSPRLELELSHVGTFKGSQKWSSTTRASKQDVTGFLPLHSQSHRKGAYPSTAGMGDGIWAGLMHAISQRYLQSWLTRWLAPPRNLSWNLLHKEKLIIFWSACPPLLQMLALSQLKDWHLKWGNWQVILVRPHWHLLEGNNCLIGKVYPWEWASERQALEDKQLLSSENVRM